MKKIVAGAAIALLLVSGCSLFKADPQAAVSSAVAKLSEVKKMSSKLSVKGEVSAPQGQKPAKIKFTLDASGKSDVSVQNSPKVDMILKIDGSADEKNGSTALTFRVLEKKFFFNMSDVALSVDTGKNLKADLVQFLGKWWTLPLGADSSLNKLTDQQKQVQELFKNTKFFTNAAEQGPDEINGIKATKYRVDLDKVALKNFIIEASKITDPNNPMTPADLKDLEDSMKEIEFSGALSVGDDGNLHRVQGTVTVQPAAGPASTFDIDFSAWDYGTDVAVAAPEGAQDFNPIVALPLFGALDKFSTPDAATAVPEDTAGVTAPAAKTKTPAPATK